MTDLRAKSNGVILGHDMRLRLDRLHHERLKWLSEHSDVKSPTVLAEKLLAGVIDRGVTELCAITVGRALVQVFV